MIHHRALQNLCTAFHLEMAIDEYSRNFDSQERKKIKSLPLSNWSLTMF